MGHPIFLNCRLSSFQHQRRGAFRLRSRAFVGSDSISSAIANIFVTLFQLRAVPGVFSIFSTADQRRDWPMPSGK
jgi:hypothetical protein